VVSVCILRDVLGEKLDVLYDTDTMKYRICDGVPSKSTWVVGDTNALMSIDALASLGGTPIRTSPPKQFKDAYDMLAPGVPIRWRSALPKSVFDSFMSGLLDDITRTLSSEHMTYYTDVFQCIRETLGALEHACIDIDRLESFISNEANHTNRAALETLRPDADGYAKVPTYDQLSTVTGRLTITSGPRMLTLSKRYRGALKSRYVGGRIALIDYRSLEARVAMLSTNRIPHTDVYAHVSDDVVGMGIITREQAKIATISLLYGASKKTIGHMTGLSEPMLSLATQLIAEYLNIDGLLRSITASAHDGMIKNGYGRPIFVSNAKKLINYYTQSTASDAAALGFSKAIAFIKERCMLMHPLFIIHDALMIDIHPDFVGYIDDVARSCESINGFDASFPVRVEFIDV
jgi:hypothetical protein